MNESIEAEIVEPTQALAVRHAIGLPTVQDLEQQFAIAVRQRELLSEYIKKQLVPGKHFYQQGTQKPSLAKEGAEIILLPHNLAPDYEQIGGPDGPPADGKPYQITIKCTLRRKGEPNSFVGSGIGSAGSEKRKKDGTYIHRQDDKYLCHNATLKMAQKSAMIAATINSTAASEFFTQDMEEMVADHPQPQRQPKPAPEPTPVPPMPKPPTGHTLRPPTKQTRKWMVDTLVEEGLYDQCREYFQKVEGRELLMPNETVADLPLPYVPNSHDEMKMLVTRIKSFLNGERAERAFEPHLDAEVVVKNVKPAAASLPPGPIKDPLWWRSVIVSIPRKGMKRDEYMRNPDTLGSLFDARHKDDEESQYMRQRLWGLEKGAREAGWVPKPREVNGKTYQPSDGDKKLYEALQAFSIWFADNHRGEKL